MGNYFFTVPKKLAHKQRLMWGQREKVLPKWTSAIHSLKSHMSRNCLNVVIKFQLVKEEFSWWCHRKKPGSNIWRQVFYPICNKNFIQPLLCTEVVNELELQANEGEEGRAVIADLKTWMCVCEQCKLFSG